MYGFAGQAPMQGNGLPDYHDQGYQNQVNEKESWYAPPQALEEQKVHVASGDVGSRNADDGLQRINSARHSLPPVRRDSLTSTHAYESESDAVSIAYGANPPQSVIHGHERRASDVVSVHSRRSSVVDSDTFEGGPTRPQRSSSRSSRASGRIL